MSKSDKGFKEFLTVIRKYGYTRIAQEIEDYNGNPMKLGSYDGVKYVFINKPVAGKPIVYIRDFNEKIGCIITSDTVTKECSFVEQ